MITKEEKTTGDKAHVDVAEFLQFVGRGEKRRENALAELIAGGIFQDINTMFYIEKLRR